MKNTITTIILCAFTVFAFSQIKVLGPNGDVGVGMTNPTTKLEVRGAVKSSNTATDYSLFDNQANGLRLGISKQSSANAIIDIDPMVGDGTSNASFRYFRSTNTTGDCRFVVHLGDGTNANNAIISGNGDSKLNSSFGNLLVGSGTATSKFSVNGSADKLGGGNWATFSDARLKKDVKAYTEGLEEILAINPVTFKYNGKAQVSDTETEFVGVIAQEMQKVSPRTVKEVETYEEKWVGDDLTGNYEKSNFETFLQYDGTAVTYMLVNAVQEQNTTIETQKEELEVLKEEMGELKALVEKLTEGGNTPTLNNVGGNGTSEVDVYELELSDNTYLGQNQPNPFNGSTVIKFSVPDNVSEASIRIYSIDGKFIDELQLTERGEGELTIEAGKLSAGTYSYTMILDGANFETKFMVLENR